MIFLPLAQQVRRIGVVRIVHAHRPEDLHAVPVAELDDRAQRIGASRAQVPSLIAVLFGFVLERLRFRAVVGIEIEHARAVEDRLHLGSRQSRGALVEELLVRKRRIVGRGERIVAVVVEDDPPRTPRRLFPLLLDSVRAIASASQNLRPLPPMRLQPGSQTQRRAEMLCADTELSWIHLRKELCHSFHHRHCRRPTSGSSCIAFSRSASASSVRPSLR